MDQTFFDSRIHNSLNEKSWRDQIITLKTVRNVRKFESHPKDDYTDPGSEPVTADGLQYKWTRYFRNSMKQEIQ